MLYPDPATMHQLVDHHNAPLLAEADARHLADTSRSHRGAGGDDMGGGASHGSHWSLRHLFAVVRHPGPQLHHSHS